MEHIQGIIIPSEWDSNGRVTGISIATFDERVLKIASCPQMERLKNHLRRRVEVWGEVFGEPEGQALRLTQVDVNDPSGR